MRPDTFGDGKMTPDDHRLQQQDDAVSSGNSSSTGFPTARPSDAIAPLQPLQHAVTQHAVPHNPACHAAADMQPRQHTTGPREEFLAAASLQSLQHEVSQGLKGRAAVKQPVQHLAQPASRKRRGDGLEKQDDQPGTGTKRFQVQAYAGPRPAWR